MPRVLGFASENCHARSEQPRAPSQQRPARAQTVREPATGDHQNRVAEMKAEYTLPISVAEIRNSWIRAGPAIDMMVRSK